MRLARLLIAAALAAVAILQPRPVAAGLSAATGPDPLEPASSGGLELVDRALARLESHRRLLIVGAHPDDEDNALLVHVARGLGGEAAYLSLSRGEGGQNLIGTELGVALGVLRTGELAAARRIEGSRQYFGRAFDFGYTRSLTETFARWPREALLEDTVRAVRRFKPQIMVAIFPADERAGHGQHQASGVIARQAFEAAGEVGRFAEMDRAGLPPWRPQAFFQRAWSTEQATVSFDLGRLDPHAGRSLAQLAAASRSRHRSQDMGREQRIGSFQGGLVWEAGPGGRGSADLFTGIDTRLAAIASTLPEGPLRAAVSRALERVEERARETRGRLAPASLGDAVEPLAEIVRGLDRALELLASERAAEGVAGLVREKRQVAAWALAAAAGVVLEATVDREQAAPGETVQVAASLWATGQAEVEPRVVRLRGELGVERRASADQAVTERGVVSWAFPVAIPSGARPTLDDYLENPRQGDLYDESSIPEAERGLPGDPPPLIAVFETEIAGAAIELEREAVYRAGDQALGEVRRPFRVVAPVAVSARPELLLWRRGEDRVAELEVTLGLGSDAEVRGELAADLAPGWKLSGPRRFALTPEEPERRIVLRLTAPPEVAVGRFPVAIRAKLEDGTEWGMTNPWLEYPHIRPAAVPRRTEVEVSVLDLELPALDGVGYVRGASDRVPSILQDLGLPVTVLTPDDLLRGDLQRFQTLVVGSRAYEIDPALAAANGRLLDFARRGGTLVVQYQQYQFAQGDFAPYRLTIDRPHGRVTDETAPVRALAPGHRALNVPHAIGEEDWRGWVQERGLYFAAEWDPRFVPLLAMADPGRPEERGALLVAPLGEGVYVYSGLSFFRQLPAGVPGAIRLFVNLLDLGSR